MGKHRVGVTPLLYLPLLNVMDSTAIIYNGMAYLCTYYKINAKTTALGDKVGTLVS